MYKEIERKFLITSDSYKKEAFQKDYIKQGFLNSDKERVVRVRIINEEAYLTIKGKSNSTGTPRFEWEKKISIQDAKQLLELCEKTIIEKYRYRVKINNHTFEIDEFLTDNKGLIVAEVELNNEDEKYPKPNWLGQEVTNQAKYYNSNLSKLPFKDWK